MSVLKQLCATAALSGLMLSASGQGAGAFREISYETGDGGRVFGNLYGESTHAVLLGHGAVFNKESWDELARELTGAGYQALAIDFRGYGKSTAGRTRGALHEDILGGIRFLKDEVGAERVSVIGASMGGGAVGDAISQAAAGDVDSVILLAAVPTGAPERMQGRKLFIVSEGDGARRSVERQYGAAGDPKQLTILAGSAHAQHIFRTAGADDLTNAILDWLAVDPDVGD